MNTNALARQYDKLTPEERFALALAAAERNDNTELDRLLHSAPRSRFSAYHHAPLLDSFLFLSKMHFMELLAVAASYFEAFGMIGQKRKKDAGPADGWDMVLLLGYLFRTRMAGWRQFCAELNVPAEFMWPSYPG